MREILGQLLSERLRIDENPVISLIIEEPKTYFELCFYAYSGFRGPKELIKVVDDEQEVEPEFIDNPFWPDLNSKKNLNALYKRLKQFGSEELEGKLRDLRQKMESIVLDVSMDFDGELECDGDIKSEDLFKMFNLRFAEDDSDGLTRLAKYISVSHELLKTGIFCIRGLHQCFDGRQIEELAKELAYRKINLIMIESIKPDNLPVDEKKIILDKDLCTIV